MKNYTITVNGNVYDVTVEEGTSGAATQASASAAPKVPAKQTPKAAPKKTAGSQGQEKIVSPMPGKILVIKGEAGQAVKKGQVVLVLEAMKMENEIVAPKDGTIASINVAVGDSVEAGDVLATMN